MAGKLTCYKSAIKIYIVEKRGGGTISIEIMNNNYIHNVIEKYTHRDIEIYCISIYTSISHVEM